VQEQELAWYFVQTWVREQIVQQETLAGVEELTQAQVQTHSVRMDYVRAAEEAVEEVLQVPLEEVVVVVGVGGGVMPLAHHQQNSLVR